MPYSDMATYATDPRRSLGVGIGRPLGIQDYHMYGREYPSASSPGQDPHLQPWDRRPPSYYGYGGTGTDIISPSLFSAMGAQGTPIDPNTGIASNPFAASRTANLDAKTAFVRALIGLMTGQGGGQGQNPWSMFSPNAGFTPFKMDGPQRPGAEDEGDQPVSIQPVR